MASGTRPAGRPSSILAIGCLADNALIEGPYYRFRTIVDRWYPGVGGFAIQPVAPAGEGEPAILVLGASGEHRWTADLGGAPAALVTGHAGPGSLTVATRDGWLSSYEAGGTRLSASRVSECLWGMAREAGGWLLAWGQRVALLQEIASAPIVSRALPANGRPLEWLRTAGTEGLLWIDERGVSLLRA